MNDPRDPPAVMRLAMRETCRLSHIFYRDPEAPAHCPVCLYRTVVMAVAELNHIKSTLRKLSQ